MFCGDVTHTLFHDSEWFVENEEKWLSTTIYLTENYQGKYDGVTYFKPIETIVYLNKSFSSHWEPSVVHLKSFFEIEKKIYELLCKHNIENVAFVNYFSPLDIYFIFPKQFPDTLYKNELSEEEPTIQLKQMQSLSGRFNFCGIKIHFYDFSCILGQSSFASKLALLKIDSNEKDLGENFKSSMNVFLAKDPYNFIKYAKNDVHKLPSIYIQSQKKINELCKALTIRRMKCPFTLGSLCAKILQSHIGKTLKKKKCDLASILKPCSQKYFLQKNPSFKNLGHIAGGRCNNEQPENFYCENAVDRDIAGCYTNIMKGLKLPLHQFSIIENNQITIGEFLSNNIFYEDYWAIDFDAKLHFDQDIFPSKIRTKKSEEFDNPDETLTAVIYFTREIKGGILTKDILKICERFWTKEQYEFLLNIKFNRAIYYLKNQVTKAYKFENLITFFQDIRKDKEHSLNQIAKLLINTLYGVMVSEHFIVGNVLIGNLITAKARSQVYMMKKKYNLFQSITDGGLCDANYNDESIELDFETTIKETNVKTFYFSKGDYAYSKTLKTRGTKNFESIKQQFYYDMLHYKSFKLKTRISYDNKIKKINSYNMQAKTKDGYIYTRHIPPGASYKMYNIFHLSALHTKFSTVEEYIKYKNYECGEKRNHHGLYEQYLNRMPFEELIKYINLRKKPSLKSQSETKSTNIIKIDVIPQTKDCVIKNLDFDTFPYTSFLLKKKFNRYNPNINIPYKTETIYFENTRIFQSEKTIYEKIFNSFMFQTKYMVRELQLIFSRYTISDNFVEYIHETIKNIDIPIKYKIYFLSTRTNSVYHRQNL